MRLHRLAAALFLLALVGGCSSDGDPVDTTPSSSAGAATATTEPNSVEGPVAGSGAAISPADVDAWCGAITAEQLTALTGFEVVGVATYGEGVGICHGELPDVDLNVSWGSELTRKSAEQYEASWAKPAGVYDVTTSTVRGQAVITATQEVPANAFAGTVSDGRLVQATVTSVAAGDSITPAQVAEMAQRIVAVYAG